MIETFIVVGVVSLLILISTILSVLTFTTIYYFMYVISPSIAAAGFIIICIAIYKLLKL